jgi:hypothetical protein
METTFGDLKNSDERTKKYLQDLCKVVGYSTTMKDKKKNFFIPELVISDPPGTNQQIMGDSINETSCNWVTSE